MQTKRYAFIFIALIALLAGLYFLKSKPKKDNLPADFQNFAIENPEEVSLIFMTDQSGDNQIYLKKQDDGTWTIIEKQSGWQKKVDCLLYDTKAKVEV